MYVKCIIRVYKFLEVRCRLNVKPLVKKDTARRLCTQPHLPCQYIIICYYVISGNELAYKIPYYQQNPISRLQLVTDSRVVLMSRNGNPIKLSNLYSLLRKCIIQAIRILFHEYSVRKWFSILG